QALETRTDTTDLRMAHPELADEVERLRYLLNQDTPSGQTWITLPAGGQTGSEDSIRSAVAAASQVATQRRPWADEWEKLLRRVRALPGFDRFGLPLTPAQLRVAAGEGTVVAVNVTEYGCGALILTANGSRHLPLPTLTEDGAIKQAERFLAAIDR